MVRVRVRVSARVRVMVRVMVRSGLGFLDPEAAFIGCGEQTRCVSPPVCWF